MLRIVGRSFQKKIDARSRSFNLMCDAIKRGCMSEEYQHLDQQTETAWTMARAAV